MSMYSEIEAKDFYEKSQSKQLIVIDVREEDEFALGHVVNSQNFPLSQLETSYVTLPQGQELYLICKSGVRSARAGHFLENKGYKVISVKGGVEAYLGDLEK